MDISQARCSSCQRPLTVTRMTCDTCNLLIEGEFEVPHLARLPLEDQMFVIAFVRHHGSIKRMESLFGVSYPTVKSRLNRISAALDETFEAPSPKLLVLEQLERGEITVEDALRRLER